MIQNRRVTLLLSAVVLVLAPLMAGCPANGGNLIYFQDAALESAVRAAAGKPLGFLTRADVLSVTEVDGSGLNIDIVDWSPLSANATNGGLGAGDVVVLPAAVTLDSNGNVFDSWVDDYLTLISQGVTLVFDGMGTTGSAATAN